MQTRKKQMVRKKKTKKKAKVKKAALKKWERQKNHTIKLRKKNNTKVRGAASHRFVCNCDRYSELNLTRVSVCHLTQMRANKTRLVKRKRKRTKLRRKKEVDACACMRYEVFCSLCDALV